MNERVGADRAHVKYSGLRVVLIAQPTHAVLQLPVWHDGKMSERDESAGEIRLQGSSGATIVIGNGVDPFSDGYDFVDFPMAITAVGLSAQTSVRSIEGDSPMSLHRFFRELADDWRGQQPDRSWEAIEHDLTIRAQRDPLGHVLLTFSLRESYRPDAWLARATVQLEAGEEMTQLATEVERLLGN